MSVTVSLRNLVIAASCLAISVPLVAAEPDAKGSKDKNRKSRASAAVAAARESAEIEAAAEAILPPLSERYAAGGVDEVPDFQRHIGPLLGHLGCNGRACHGSFQGRGGFALSLFGYDFAADHAALTDEDSGRVDVDDVAESLILDKPIDADRHEGGKRMDVDSWQYRVLARWVEGGAKFDGKIQQLERLEVSPAEIIFSGEGQETPLHIVAHWADGTREEVTDLCRFTTNDDAIAKISESGLVTAGDTGDTDVVVAYDRAVVTVPVLRPAGFDTRDIERPAESDHPIDRLVQKRLDKLGIIPSLLCSDEDFIRRASLDLTGMLPSAERVEQFLADESPKKRAELIDELIRSPGYAAWWATRFSDWTGNNEAELNNYLPVRGVATKLWFGWLQKRLVDNMPYDQIVEGIVTAESRLPGESFTEYCETMSEICRTADAEAFAERPGLPTYWARRNFRTTEERAIGFAYTFLGVKIECAQCHKHPFDQWSKDDFDQFARLFAPVRAAQNTYAPDSQREMRAMVRELTDGKELRGGELRRMMTRALTRGAVVPIPELTIGLPRGRQQGRNRNVPEGRILGEPESMQIVGDPRGELMRWLRDPENPYFSKAIVNRVWASYFGVGIVNPIDDLNLGNAPSNAELLDYLAQGFIDSGYNLHWLHREIMTSDAYQRSSEANKTNVLDTRNFSRHVPRRLPAEVLRDAIVLATAGSKAEAAARSELTGLAISGEMTTQRRGRGDFALQVFGQSTRESNCDCDRSDQSNLLQSLFLRNDIDVHQALASRDGWVREVAKEWGIEPAGRDGARPADRDGAERMRRFLLSRVEAYLDLPPQRQQANRPRLRAEIERVNRRVAQRGGEPFTLAALIREVRGGDAEEVSDDEKPASEKPRLDRGKIEEAIHAAYLRTLSRRADADELDAAYSYIADASDPVSGLRAVAWALLNTKEFILTH